MVSFQQYLTSHLSHFNVIFIQSPLHGCQWLSLNFRRCFVRVFAPQYPARKGRVLFQLLYLPALKKILIDLKLVICQKCSNFMWPWKIWCYSWQIFETCVFTGEFYVDPCPTHAWKLFFTRFPTRNCVFISGPTQFYIWATIFTTISVEKSLQFSV